MNTICNKCGQTNAPGSNYCERCSNFIKQGNQITVPTTKTTNDTMLYWMIGGGFLVILVGVFAMSVAGAGTYWYYSTNRNPVRKDYPVEQNKPQLNKPERNVEQNKPQQPQPPTKAPVAENKDDFLSKVTNEDIQQYINEELINVGKYKLGKTGTPKPFFIGAKTEQYGLYYYDNKETVLLTMATYPTAQEAKDFFENKVSEVRQNGGEIKYRKDNGESSWVIFRTQKEGGQIMKCSKGICFNVKGATDGDVADFFQAYETKASK